MTRIAAVFLTLVGVALTTTTSALGASWKSELIFERVPSTYNELRDVSCTAGTACTAVGHYDTEGEAKTLATRWNGKEWTIETPPNPLEQTQSELWSVSCVSATACFAVGGAQHGVNTQKTLVEFWNGKEWKIQSSPNPATSKASILKGVACVSTTSCVAVGDFANGTSNETLVESWNGTEWKIVKSPNPSTSFNQLVSVSCSASNACTAVGNDVHEGHEVGLVERWNGTEWALQTPAAPAEATYVNLYDADCLSATECYIVGTAKFGTSGTSGDIQIWNGKEWKLQTSPNPSGAKQVLLHGIACTSGTVCEAVGDYINSESKVERMAQRWNGKEWTLQAVESLSAKFSALLGLSCTAAAECQAAGEVENLAGKMLGLIETYA
jgi:hypothetical protein